MNVAAKLALSMGVVCLALLVGKYAWDYQRHSYRVRVMVEVETPKGLRAGSSVMEIYAERIFSPLPESRSLNSGLHGQAVAIETESGTIFAIFGDRRKSEPFEQIVTRSLRPRSTDFLAAVQGLSHDDGKTSTLPDHGGLRLVRFRDKHDPSSIESVGPETAILKEAKVTTVADNISSGIEDNFPWWNSYANLFFSGASRDIFFYQKQSLRDTLTIDDFKR